MSSLLTKVKANIACKTIYAKITLHNLSNERFDKVLDHSGLQPVVV